MMELVYQAVEAKMCSIAGILFKNDKRPNLGMTTGQALTEMLNATVHRGPDSVGWALYYEPHPDELRLRFFTAEGQGGKGGIHHIKRALAEQGAEIVADQAVGCTYGVRVRYTGDVRKLSYAMRHTAEVVSVGTRLDILKDVGLPHEIAPIYGIGEFDGDHGLGHVRLATESGVHPNTSHPFWASGFADVATAHNGQLTNYWIMRRRLERKGMEFQTENDTELIGVYLAYRMSLGASLDDALKTSLEDLDGTFSYLVATEDSIGYAKDKLAAKPMVKYEDDDLIAISSEEVGINRLFPGRALDTTEPPPLTSGLWSRS
jgi:glutamate synthase domain-containing protein 1